MSFLADEHVPRVFNTTLRSNGHEVVGANEVFGEATEDDELLRYAGANGYVLITHDRKDFGGVIAETIDHAGVVVYTDAKSSETTPRVPYGRSNASSPTIHWTNLRTTSSGSTSGDGSRIRAL